MPTGSAGIKKASAKASKGKGQKALWLKLPEDGDIATVRFLEEYDADEPENDIHHAEMHSVPMKGFPYGKDVPCIDPEQESGDCPGCNSGDDDIEYQRFRGFVNVIWRDAPIYKRDKKGKIVKVDKEPIIEGHKDQVAIWAAGIRVFEELQEQHEETEGLTSCDFKIKRKGEDTDTTYRITPVDRGKPVKMSKEDKELAGKKYDLNRYVEAPTKSDFNKMLDGELPDNNGGGRRKRDDDDPAEKAKKVNPFKRNK